MIKNKAWDLLINNYVAILGLTYHNGDINRMIKIVRAIKEFIPDIVKKVKEKPTRSGYVLKFDDGREIDYDDFDKGYKDKYNSNIIYLVGHNFTGAFYIIKDLDT